MTKTIPRNLKRKLQASLENLTPRQSGRLFLLLYHEANDKNAYPADYPPIKDLDAAWDRRLDRARGKDTYAQEVKLYNGYSFLRNLVAFANMTGSSDVWQRLVTVTHVYYTLDRLLLMDSFSETARLVTGYLGIGETMPWPASREEFDRLTAWVEEDDVDDIEMVADYLVEDWLEGQNFEEYRADEDFIRTYNAAQGEKGFNLIIESEGSRRAWAEAQGDRLLQETFAGNRDDLDAWVKHGGYLRDADRRKEAAKDAEFEAHLVALLEAGELEGGLAVSPKNLETRLLLDAAGTIPAWAALRAAWYGWLYDQGYRQHEYETPHHQALAGVHVIYNAAGEVEGDDLAALAGDFLKDCKKRAWGRNLPAPKSVDLTALGFFLTLDSMTPFPFLADKAPDLGRVDWETFRQAEPSAFYGDGEPYPVATVGSLKAKIEGYVGKFWLLDHFYPTDDPETRRRALARILRLTRAMQVSHRAFTYPPKVREDMKVMAGDLADYLGVEFYTPLEQAVRDLGETFGRVATFRRTYDILTDEYFGVFPCCTRKQWGYSTRPTQC